MFNDYYSLQFNPFDKQQLECPEHQGAEDDGLAPVPKLAHKAHDVQAFLFLVGLIEVVVFVHG